MSGEITQLRKIWSKEIDRITQSQKLYYNYDEEQITWLNNNLVDIFLDTDFPPESTYKSLVMLDRNRKCGRYALIFNQKIYTSTINKNLEELRNICLLTEYSELEALSDEENKMWSDEIKTEMLAYNLYTDRLVMCTETSLEICYSEALSFIMNNNGEYINSECGHIVFLSDMTDRLIITPMREIDLIFILLSDGNNPYTNLPLSEQLKNNLINKNREMMLVCRRAVKLGYKHKYMF